MRDCLNDPVSLQLFPVVEELMLQPLWESRDHYEELKQIDDTMKEVNVCAAESAWPSEGRAADTAGSLHTLAPLWRPLWTGARCQHKDRPGQSN